MILTQDVLREVLLAPGNPWEASYLVPIGVDGRSPAKGLLLPCREPLTFDGRSTAATAATDGASVDLPRAAAMFVRHGVI
jgi:hypothetical protein